MTEREIKETTEVQIEVQELLEEYGLSKTRAEEATDRIVNILLEALDALQDERESA